MKWRRPIWTKKQDHLHTILIFGIWRGSKGSGDCRVVSQRSSSWKESCSLDGQWRAQQSYVFISVLVLRKHPFSKANYRRFKIREELRKEKAARKEETTEMKKGNLEEETKVTTEGESSRKREKEGNGGSTYGLGGGGSTGEVIIQ